MEKLSQIKPVLLFVDNAVTSHGKIHESTTKMKEIVKLLPTLHAVVIFKTVDELPVETSSIDVVNGQAYTYTEFLAGYVNRNLSLHRALKGQ